MRAARLAAGAAACFALGWIACFVDGVVASKSARGNPPTATREP